MDSKEILGGEMDFVYLSHYKLLQYILPKECIEYFDLVNVEKL